MKKAIANKGTLPAVQRGRGGHTVTMRRSSRVSLAIVARVRIRRREPALARVDGGGGHEVSREPDAGTAASGLVRFRLERANALAFHSDGDAFRGMGSPSSR